MKILRTKLSDSLWCTGFILMLLSGAFFMLPAWLPDNDNYFGFFMLHFAIAIGYQVQLWLGKSAKVENHKRHYTMLLLILLLISAYALNREMTVFAASPFWLAALLVLLCINYISAFFFEYLPRWVQYISFFLLGIALVLFIYLSLYLLPMYALSAVALIALGISFHTFVPLLFSIYTVLLARKLAEGKRMYWYSMYGGITGAIAVVTCFCFMWQAHTKTINQAYTHAIAEGTGAVPAWIQIAQKIQPDIITEKILKTNLVYVVPQWDGSLFWNLPGRTFGEEQQIHDPLVVMATLFGGTVYLDEEDKIKILKSQFDGRHQTEEKLWTGRDLRTQQVITRVNIWPASHLSYTEKTITVFNHSTGGWVGDQQEALYTFQLPEGGVATALSLWIEGKEEKGILTTKEKADSAYKTIVGVEVRDPSVVHWQEGNRVTVRVFPVLSNRNRTFKIGITAPLQYSANKLVYNNISFTGPNASAASEDVKINLHKGFKGAVQQASFMQEGSNSYTRSGRYRKQWQFVMADEGLAPQTFHFGGYQYSIKPYKPQRTAMHLTDVYLDINSALLQADMDAVWNSAQGKDIWIYKDELIKLDKENKQTLFKELTKNKFSLFPLHLIQNVPNALLVTKCGTPSPNLSDLKGSLLEKELKAFGSKNLKIRLFNIGDVLTPYLASLKEHRFFLYAQGDGNALTQLIQQAQFVTDGESDNEIVIHTAGIAIHKSILTGAMQGTAPDHVMRLFAYNHIMQQLGPMGWQALPETDALVQEAEEAYVVSPISSLVVLESKKDYERFYIKSSQQSLENASIKSKGAVPEPHEWVLIILFAAFAIYLMLKSPL